MGMSVAHDDPAADHLRAARNYCTQLGDVTRHEPAVIVAVAAVETQCAMAAAISRLADVLTDVLETARSSGNHTY